jgi:hypothetical protein
MIGHADTWNTTQSTMVSNSMSLGSTMALVVCIAVLCFGISIMWYAGSNLQRYKRLWKVLNHIGTVFVCAFIGAVVIGVFWVAYIILSEIFKAVGSFDPMLLAYAAGGFAVCAILGAVVLHLIDKVATTSKEAKGDTIEELRAQ